MMMTPFTCDTFAEHLADHLDGDAAPAVRAAMDAHTVECAACNALVGDIASIRSDAATLPVLMPDRDLWDGIAERIGSRVVPISSAAGRRSLGTAPASGQRRWWAHPALAAAALVGITAGVTHYVTRQTLVESPSDGPVATAPTAEDRGSVVGGVPSAGGAVAEGASGTGEGPMTPEQGGSSARAVDAAGGGPPMPGNVQVASGGRSSRARGQDAASRQRGTGIAEVRGDRRQPSADVTGGASAVLVSYREGDIAALDSLYYREIIRLRQVLGQRRAQLDSSTVAVIDRNMLVIDKAIQECRAALGADPASKFLNQQLNEALESKIELLRTAAMMPVGS